MAISPLAVAAARSLEVGAPAEVGEVAQRGVADEDDVGATAPVAAVGPPARDVRLAAEGDHAVAAGAGLHEYLGAVGEHCSRARLRPAA